MMRGVAGRCFDSVAGGCGALVLAAAVCTLLAGCGSQAYEQRLRETSKYYAYVARLNRHLDRTPWNGPGITVRVPRQFKLRQAPAAPKVKAGDKQQKPAPVDRRQPKYVAGGLPGLVGAWRAELASGKSKVPCDLFILSNVELLRKKAPQADAENFLNTAVTRVVSAFGDPKEAWPEVVVPLNHHYSPEKSFRKARFEPTKKIHGKTVDVKIYYARTQKAKILVMLVFVVPKDVSARERMDAAIGHCLETLSIADQKPAAPKRRSAPGF